MMATSCYRPFREKNLLLIIGEYSLSLPLPLSQHIDSVINCNLRQAFKFKVFVSKGKIVSLFSSSIQGKLYEKNVLYSRFEIALGFRTEWRYTILRKRMTLSGTTQYRQLKKQLLTIRRMTAIASQHRYPLSTFFTSQQANTLSTKITTAPRTARPNHPNTT